MREQWKDLLRAMPVAVNNFYGDPMVQWSNTSKKLQTLVDIGHTGPVGIITRGVMTERHAKQMQVWCEAGLNIIVLVSISELHEFERVGHAHRYRNIALLAEHGVPAIAYIRPFIPPYNTSEAVVRLMVERVAQNGGKTIVASGFRGDEAMVRNLSPDQQAEWVMRVKQMPGDTYRSLKAATQEYGLQLFLRTACGVSYLAGHTRPYNPYFNSRSLVKCYDLTCPLLETCGAAGEPNPGSMELLSHLGYQVEIVPGEPGARCCSVTGENRLSCPSCCTTCYMASAPVTHVRVHGSVNLGDLAFIRFITGLLAMKPGVNDDGAKDIGTVHLPNFPQVQMQVLNSWMPWSRTIERCYGCSYCVVSEYYNQAHANEETGFAPVQLLEMIGA